MTGDGWNEGAFFRRRPSAETVAWVEASTGGRVVGHRRLTGGVNSAVHRLTLERGGARTSVVLRQYPPGSAALRAALADEIAHLGIVATSTLPVPRILADDVAGLATGGAPSLLMTRLPGRIRMDPTDRGPWLTEIARFAADMHRLDLPAPTFRPWVDSWIAPLDRLRVPTGARRPDVWRAAFDVVREPPPVPDEAVFLHCDFLPVNLLWSRGRISGMTDWNGIRRGSRAIDVGQCRRYLASMSAPAWAEELGERYESIAGVRLDPWWDVYALLHHSDDVPRSVVRQVAGRRDVDAAGMTARVEVVLARALQRLG